MIGFCPRCGRSQDTQVVHRRDTFPVRGEPTEVEVDIRVCGACGEEITDVDLEDVNLLRAYSEYRNRHGLLPPQDVLATRELLGLSQRDLAKLLGWSPATVNRYERTGCMSPAHDQVLRALQTPVGVKRILDTRAPALTQEEVEAFAAILGGDTLEDEKRDHLCGTLEQLGRSGIGRIAAVIGLLAGANGIYKTKLMKLMFYADFAHYRTYGRSISGATYVHMQWGPVVDDYDLILAVLRQEKLVDVELEEHEEWSGEIVRPLFQVAPGTLADTEVDMIEAVLRRLGGLTAKRLSDLSHLERAWTETRNGQEIPYAYADSLRAID